MKTTVEFLEEIKAKYGLKSNYALAKKMGQTDTGVARWMHRKGSFSDETCLQVADLLDIDPAYVMACIHAEREKNEKLRALWERIATLTTGIAAALVVFHFVPFEHFQNGLGFVSVGFTDAASGALYIMSNADPAFWLPIASAAAALFLALPRYNRPLQ
jgi:hypothetical protein